MLKLYFIIFILFYAPMVWCQHSKTNNLFFEIGGNGLFMSINYEKKIFKNQNLYAHAGVGIYGIKPSYVTIPFGINYLLPLKNKNNFIEIGFGVTYTKANVKLYSIVDSRPNQPVEIRNINLIPSIAYRHHTKSLFMYKFSLTPVFNQYDGLPFIGVSIGKLF